MNGSSDLQLLRDYAERRSEEAFAELVGRHVDFVFSAALRMVRDAHLAEDVTQSVFTALAQNARQLKDRPVLSGWLHRTTQNIAAQTVRSEVRRRAREQEAAAMHEMSLFESDAAWENIAPHLDAAMSELNEADRDALFLRYFQRKSAREIAQIFAVSEEAAQKRVNRAIERLRESFFKRGVAIGPGSVIGLISANAVQSAPAGLGATISTAINISTISQTAIGATKAIAMTTLQKTLITAAIAVSVGTGIHEARRASRLEAQIESIQQQQASAAGSLEQLQHERDEVRNKVSELGAENDRLRQSAAETIRLHNEVHHLEATGNALDPSMNAAFKMLADRAAQLKQRLEQMPDKKIPELQLLVEKDWFDAVKNLDKLETDADFRRAMQQLRSIAKSEFSEMTRVALKAYLQAYSGQLPTDLSQLKPYYPSPIDDEILQRYTLLHTGSFSDVPLGQPLVAETAPSVDDPYDTSFQIDLDGTKTSNFANLAVEQAAYQYANANNGLLPTDPSQLTPYLGVPVDPGLIQKTLAKTPPGVTTLDQLNAYHKR